MDDLDAQISAARTKRRIGYAILGALTAYLSIPMLIGSIGGVARGEIYDPYTGEHLDAQASAARWCFDESSRLFQEAGKLESINRRWEEPAKQWIAKCRDEHPELLQVMMQTRDDLRKRGKK